MRHPGNLSYVLQEEKYINFNHFMSAVKRIYNYKYSLMPLFISLKYSLNLNRSEKELELKKNNFNDYSKISNEVVSIYKKEGDIGKSNFDFRKNLEQEKKININTKIKTTNQTFKQQYLNNITNSNIGRSTKNPKLISSSFDYHRNNRYTINYNKICGLEVYPGKIKIKEKEKIGGFNPNRLSTLPLSVKSVNIQDKKGNINGYMTLVEILEEINMLINKQNKIDAGGEELNKVWIETRDENERNVNLLKEPFPPTTIETLKPYIFEDIFQKKLH